MGVNSKKSSDLERGTVPRSIGDEIFEFTPTGYRDNLDLVFETAEKVLHILGALPRLGHCNVSRSHFTLSCPLPRPTHHGTGRSRPRGVLLPGPSPPFLLPTTVPVTNLPKQEDWRYRVPRGEEDDDSVLTMTQ